MLPFNVYRKKNGYGAPPLILPHRHRERPLVDCEFVTPFLHVYVRPRNLDKRIRGHERVSVTEAPGRPTRTPSVLFTLKLVEH